MAVIRGILGVETIAHVGLRKKIGEPFLKVPIIRISVLCGLYWGFPCFGKLSYHLENYLSCPRS